MMLQNLPHTEMGRKCLLELRCHVLNAVTIIRLKTVVEHWSSMKNFKGVQLFGIVACLCSVKNENLGILKKSAGYPSLASRRFM